MRQEEGSGMSSFLSHTHNPPADPGLSDLHCSQPQALRPQKQPCRCEEGGHRLWHLHA